MSSSVHVALREEEISTGMPMVSNTAWVGTVTDRVAATATAPAGIRVAWQGEEATVVPLSACHLVNGQIVVQFAVGSITSEAMRQTGVQTRILDGDETLTLPIITEMLHTEAVWRESGNVRIHVRGEEFPYTTTEETTHEELQVEQVAVGRVLADGETAEPRQEGDVYIVPVIREEVVMTKRRILDHELRVTKRAVATMQTVETTLRRTCATVDAGALAARTHVDAALLRQREE